ncbi:MAG: periplasmic heavy metal sensor [Bacteroidetes bacterium]|jgi:Spy/CpxP family protein refolding chaperone|nr:periplasmic heavy metal sensor [Bacteroidota bacterium]
MKNNWLIILIIFLLVLNASMLGTFLYQQKQMRSRIETMEKPAMANPEPPPRMGRFFRQTLGLSQEQHHTLREIRQHFHQQGYKLQQQLSVLNRQLLDEMTSSLPDTSVIHNLTKEIGNIHQALKYQSYTYYVQMREICTPEQVEILDSLLLQSADSDMGLRRHRPRHQFK